MPDYPPAIPAGLDRYLEVRRLQHLADRNAIVAGLTIRERALVRDAAVMGYVQGTMAAEGGKVPPDGVIVTLVLDGCLAMPDLYPAIRRACRRGLRKAGARSDRRIPMTTDSDPAPAGPVITADDNADPYCRCDDAEGTHVHCPWGGMHIHPVSDPWPDRGAVENGL